MRNGQDNQPRKPKGSTEGGQFAGREHGDAGLSLVSQESPDFDERFGALFNVPLENVASESEYNSDEDVMTCVVYDASKPDGLGPSFSYDMDEFGEVVAATYRGSWRDETGRERVVMRDTDRPIDLNDFMAECAWATKVQRGLDRDFNSPLRRFGTDPDLPPEVEVRVGAEPPRTSGGQSLVITDNRSGREVSVQVRDDGYIYATGGPNASDLDDVNEARQMFSRASELLGAKPSSLEALAYKSMRLPNERRIEENRVRTSTAVSRNMSGALHRAVEVTDTGSVANGVKTYVLRAHDKSFTARLDVAPSGRIDAMSIMHGNDSVSSARGLEPGELGKFIASAGIPAK